MSLNRASVTRRVLRGQIGDHLATRSPHGKTDTSLTSPHGKTDTSLTWLGWVLGSVAAPVSQGRAGPPHVRHRTSAPVSPGRAGPQSRLAGPRINDVPAGPYDSVSTIGAAFISLEGVPHPKGDERSEWRGDRGERSEQRARPELAKGLRGFSGILP